MNEPEKVALDRAATEEIADAVASRLDKSYTTPNRPQREPAGIVAKRGDPVFYGGDDVYTSAGRTAGQVATNLWLAKQLIEIPEGRSGRSRPASDRHVDVMTKAARQALEQPVDFGDADGFVTQTYAAMVAEARTKALTSTAGGAGDEWVPTLSSADLWAEIHLDTTVASTAVRRVDMPSNPYDLPTHTSEPVFRYVSTENTAVVASDPTTAKATLTAKKIQAEVNFSGEMTEDSIVPVVSSLREMLVRRAAQSIDDLIVSGDTETGGTGNVNSDDGAPAAGTFYLALDGMRKFCIVTNTGQAKQYSGAPSTTLLLAQRALMSKYGARASDLVWIVPPSTSYAMQDVAQFLTVDKFGPQATVRTGQLGNLFGSPVVAYEAIPGTTSDKVDADGKYTTTTPASNDTKGWLLCVNRTGWTTGFRRGVQIESYRDIQKDENILVCSFRMALIPSGISVLHSSIGYNVTV